MLASVVTFVIGGSLHPAQDPTLPEAAGLAAWIGDAQWVPSHALLLVAAILLVPGLLGLLAARPWLSTAARRAGWVAVVAAALWALEGVPHLAAASESAAAAAGQPTPILFSHMVLSLFAYPLIGLSVAALAVLGGRRLAHPAFAVAAVVGGVAWAAAPWAVGPLGIEGAGVLFPVGGNLMVLWFAAVAVGELVGRRSGARERAAA